MTVRERFEQKYVPEPNTGCWLWTASLNNKGYGELNVAGKARLAHRLSHELFIGPIPAGMSVCHKCDTPACVNPKHMFAGSHADNMRDALRKGRLRFDHLDASAKNALKTHCKLGHPYDYANTYMQSSGSRRCRKCHSIRERERCRTKRNHALKEKAA